MKPSEKLHAEKNENEIYDEIFEKLYLSGSPKPIF